MPYTCPKCGKIVKHLPDHLKRMHTEEKPDSDAGNDQSDEDAPAVEVVKSTSKKFSVKRPQKSTEYHCVDCGTAIKHGQETCTGCGGQLDWTAVK